MNKWKILSEKQVFKAKLFEVKELKIKQNGRDLVHHIAKRHPTISVIPVTENLEIYLVSQYRYMLEKQTLEAMAGFIDVGETPLDASKRELKEETGISAKEWIKLTEIEMAASVFKGVNHIFLAKDLTHGTAHNEEGEEISLVKIPLDEAVGKVIKGEINHSASVIGILLIDKLRTLGKI